MPKVLLGRICATEVLRRRNESAVCKVKRKFPDLMKETGFYVLMATCVLLLASCSGLNESAQNVKYSTKSEAPKNCKEIGEVSVGSFLPHVTMESVKNEMRNKTSAMGGNFLVIDEIKSVSSSTPPMVGSNGLMMGGGSSSSGYAGSGRAYQCPQS